MSFAPTITILSKSGTVKALAADNITRDMRADAMWYSGSACEITPPKDLSNADEEWIIWEQKEWIKVKFTPDSGYPDGQGFSVQADGFFWTVDALPTSGKVYIIRAKHVNMLDKKVNLYSSSFAVNANVGDKLSTGDVIVCDCSSTTSFSLKIETELLSGMNSYVAMGIVSMGLCDY